MVAQKTFSADFFSNMPLLLPAQVISRKDNNKRITGPIHNKTICRVVSSFVGGNPKQFYDLHIYDTEEGE